jgi:hypothetical protein
VRAQVSAEDEFQPAACGRQDFLAARLISTATPARPGQWLLGYPQFSTDSQPRLRLLSIFVIK